MDIELINMLMELVKEVGLGVGMAVIIVVFFSFLLKKTLGDHDKDRDMFVKMLENKEKLMGNHLSHMNENMMKLENCIDKQGISQTNASEKIVCAIDAQTKLLQSMIQKNREDSNG